MICKIQERIPPSAPIKKSGLVPTFFVGIDGEGVLSFAKRNEGTHTAGTEQTSRHRVTAVSCVIRRVRPTNSKYTTLVP